MDSQENIEENNRAKDAQASAASRLVDEGGRYESEQRLHDALKSYEQACVLDPELSLAHYKRGNVLCDLGRETEALGAYDAALARRPDWAECHFNKGNTQLRLGSYEDALESCGRATDFHPGFVDAWIVQGVAQEALRRTADAIVSYQRAIELAPEHAGANLNLADAYLTLGDMWRAGECLRTVLRNDPTSLRASLRLVIILRTQGRLDEAEALGARALASHPKELDLLCELGIVSLQRGALADAVMRFEQVVSHEGRNLTALHNLGAAYQLQTNYSAAERVYRIALEVDPGNVKILSNFGLVLTEQGMAEAAIGVFDRICELSSDARTVTEALSNKSFSRNFSREPGIAETAFAEAAAFGTHVTRMAKPFTEWNALPVPERKLRLGLVSGDLRRHPVAFFLEQVLSALVLRSKERVEVFAYATTPFFDSYSERIKRSCTQWRAVGDWAYEDLATCIHEDAIDVLIDLAGHTSHNRLPVFAWKPAPVQVTWLGYFATTGVPQIDYLIADPWTLPESEEKYFSERIWRLPETRLCFSPPREKVSVSALPALAHGYVTFGCFNNSSKVSDEVIALWAQILVAVPGSRLFLKSKQMHEAGIKDSFVRRFAAYGISSERLLLEGWSSREDYLAAYGRVDIGLDPFPFPGGTTTMESLWMGVPVLTLAGQRFLSRQGVGLLINAGLPEWVAKDEDDYLHKAVVHAGDLKVLAGLRSGLREAISTTPIFDAERFSEHLDGALRQMWRDWCATQKQAAGLEDTRPPNIWRSLLGRLKK